MKAGRLEIRTPEGITFSLLLAGPATRFVAWAIDTFIIFCMIFTTNLILLFFALISFDLTIMMIALAQFVIMFGYSITLEWLWRGQTIGKRIMRLRVMDEQGLRLRFSQVVIRNLLRTVDRLPLLYAAGGAACLVSKNSQRLGDIAASTVVVRTPKLQAPNLENLLAGKFNAFRQHRQIAARMRQHVSPREAQLALQALLRRESLEPKERVALYAELADHFRELVNAPQETTDGLSDEQYLRNIIDVVFHNAE